MTATNSRFELLKPGDEAEWDKFVLRHPSGTVYHLAGWKQALEQAFTHYKGLVLTLRNPADDSLVGGLPIYQVRSGLIGNRLVSTPFACYCDPLLSSPEQFAALAPHILSLQRELSCRRIELRVRDAASRSCEPFGAFVQGTHHYIDLHADAETLWRSFSKTSVRQMVARSGKVRVVVRDAEDQTDLAAFYELLTLSRKRLGIPAIPAAFFDALWHIFSPDRIKVRLATLDGTPVAGILTLSTPGVTSLEYAADCGKHRASGANQRLYWEAIKAAREAGCHRFSLGRTLSLNSGLTAYKRRWGAQEESLVTLRHPSRRRDSPALADGPSLRSVAQTIVRASPTAVYRVFSGLFYQHWG